MALTKVTGGTLSPTANYVINNITGAAATFTSLDCSSIDLSTDDLKVVGIITNTPLTAGSVVFVGTGNTLTESDNLTWDNTNVRLKNLGITSTKSLNVTGVSTFSGNVNLNGVSSFAGGVGIADSIFHIGDTHTAIRFAGNDIITAEIGGGETLRIDSSGLKIADKLIHSGDTDTFLEFGTNIITFDTAGEERVQIRADGRTQIRSGDFEVIGGEGEDAEIRITADEGDDGADTFRIQSNATDNRLKIASFHIGSWKDLLEISSHGSVGFTSVGINTNVNTNGCMVDINHGTMGQTAITNHSHIIVKNRNASNDNWWSIAPRDSGRLGIGRGTLDNNGTVSDEKFTIESGGDVGVNITDPVAQLQVNSTRNAETDRHTAANYHLALRNPADDNGEAIGLSFGITSNATKVGASILHERDAGGSQGSLQLYTSPDGNSLLERLRITSSGIIGVSGNRDQVAPTAYDDLTDTNNASIIIGSSGITTAGIMFRTGTNGSGRLYFGDNSGNDAGRKQGRIEYHNNGDHMLFATAGDERLRIHADGEVECKGGAAGQNALLVSGNYSSGNNVDIQTWQRIGGAVQAKIGYKDADTSMFFGTDTAHKLCLMTSGTERLRITSAGNVGISSDSPVEAFTITRNQRVGICSLTNMWGSTAGGSLLFMRSGRGDGTVDTDLICLNSWDNTRIFRVDNGGNMFYKSGLGGGSQDAMQVFGVRAWALFDGSGSAHLDGSGNFSSVTDNSTGNYTFNFTNNMPSANYVITGSTGRNATPHFSLSGNNRSTSSFTVSTGTWGSSYSETDVDSVMLIVCG